MSAPADLLAATTVASVNGVALNAPGEALAREVLRQRACSELLRQAAQHAGLLDSADTPYPGGVMSEAASQAIDALLAQALHVPEPSDEACRRHHAAHSSVFAKGERAHVRHILLAVTPGVDVVALRKRAEPILLDVRCHDGQGADAFATAARKWSNCPSGERGGDLGLIGRDDCVPEFAREIFGRVEIGVLPRLVHSRFGLHVVEVLARVPGAPQSFEAVRGAVATALRQKAFVTALRQYLRLLAAEAVVQGVDLEAAATPLVQ